MKPFRICIVSVHAYPVINPRALGSFGGMETRSWCFARELARLPDTEVSFVVTHREAPRHSIVDQVHVVQIMRQMDWYHEDLSEARKALKKGRSISFPEIATLGLKLVAWVVTRPFRVGLRQRWSTPSRDLTDFSADIYVGFGLNSQSVCTVLSAQSIQRPFVLCLTSDSDLDPRLADDSGFVDPYGASSAAAKNLFREADGIVVQNAFQQQQLQRVWRRDSVRIANPLDLAAWDEEMRAPVPEGFPRSPFVLWIGRADRFHKRPLELLPVIRAFPRIPFVMVLNRAESDVQAELEGAGCANLTIIPQVQRHQMASVMRAAALFATTSAAAFEGVPNVLLQAAGCSTPVVSLEAAADWIEESGCGVCLHGNHELFAATIARLYEERDSPEMHRYAKDGRKYVEIQHDATGQSRQFWNFLREVTQTAPTRKPNS